MMRSPYSSVVRRPARAIASSARLSSAAPTTTRRAGWYATEFHSLTHDVDCVYSSSITKTTHADSSAAPKATLKLYSDFKSAEHLNFARGEDRMRFGLFRKNAAFIAAANSNTKPYCCYTKLFC